MRYKYISSSYGRGLICKIILARAQLWSSVFDLRLKIIVIFGSSLVNPFSVDHYSFGQLPHLEHAYLRTSISTHTSIFRWSNGIRSGCCLTPRYKSTNSMAICFCSLRRTEFDVFLHRQSGYKTGPLNDVPKSLNKWYFLDASSHLYIRMIFMCMCVPSSFLWANYPNLLMYFLWTGYLYDNDQGWGWSQMGV